MIKKKKQHNNQITPPILFFFVLSHLCKQTRKYQIKMQKTEWIVHAKIHVCFYLHNGILCYDAPCSILSVMCVGPQLHIRYLLFVVAAAAVFVFVVVALEFSQGPSEQLHIKNKQIVNGTQFWKITYNRFFCHQNIYFKFPCLFLVYCSLWANKTGKRVFRSRLCYFRILHRRL